ncbi:hypothetical protein Tco_0630036 [Tanacetum coccineum]
MNECALRPSYSVRVRGDEMIGYYPLNTCIVEKGKDKVISLGTFSSNGRNAWRLVVQSSCVNQEDDLAADGVMNL